MNTSVHSVNAPQAIGPYSQAIKVGNTVYCSGQIPLDPQTMELVSQDFKQQAIQVLKNLHAVADAAGGDLGKVVKLTVYLTNLQDFVVLNEVMKDFFDVPYPARVTIQVSALPKAALVEIDAILVL